MSLAAKARRREKGYAALSGGMVAVGSGDARAASRLAAEARKHLGDEPLTKLLRAQAAQLAGDRAAAAAAFRDMLEHAPTHALGLRGLHIEARRSGDHERALEYARAPISTPRCPGRRRPCSTTARARRLGGRAGDRRIQRRGAN